MTWEYHLVQGFQKYRNFRQLSDLYSSAVPENVHHEFEKAGNNVETSISKKVL